MQKVVCLWCRWRWDPTSREEEKKLSLHFCHRWDRAWLLALDLQGLTAATQRRSDGYTLVDAGVKQERALWCRAQLTNSWTEETQIPHRQILTRTHSPQITFVRCRITLAHPFPFLLIPRGEHDEVRPAILFPRRLLTPMRGWRGEDGFPTRVEFLWERDQVNCGVFHAFRDGWVDIMREQLVYPGEIVMRLIDELHCFSRFVEEYISPSLPFGRKLACPLIASGLCTRQDVQNTLDDEVRDEPSQVTRRDPRMDVGRLEEVCDQSIDGQRPVERRAEYPEIVEDLGER